LNILGCFTRAALAYNGLQPGVSGDASGLRCIGKIKFFREN
jgi:hypothetical protein